MAEPPLDVVYSVVCIDALHVILDRSVVDRPIYVTLAVTVGASQRFSDCGPARAWGTGCTCSPRARTTASTTC